MAERDVTGRTGAGNTGSPGIAPGADAHQGVQEDLSQRGPVDERMLDLGRDREQGEITPPANQESGTGIVSRG